MKIVIIDGQGGKIGRAIVDAVIKLAKDVELVAIGTNSFATTAMIKAGAQYAATGENPVLVNACDADIIIGPVGIIAANSLMGEVTPKMALAVSESKAEKILIPVTKCKITVAGVAPMPMNDYVEAAIKHLIERVG